MIYLSSGREQVFSKFEQFISPILISEQLYNPMEAQQPFSILASGNYHWIDFKLEFFKL